MHSFLIVSKNKKTALDFTSSECEKNQIDKLDVTLLTFEKAIGIENIRNFQRQLYLRPIKSKTKAIILDVYTGITIQSQNALLKLLEEPPANTIIYIAIQNKDLLLPTVLSRCKIIELKDDSSLLTKQEVDQYLDVLISLPQKSIGERLKLAQDITKNKSEPILWVEKMIVAARRKLIDIICHSESQRGISVGFPQNQNDNASIKSYLTMLSSFQKTHTILSTTNANQRLVLENLFLSL